MKYNRKNIFLFTIFVGQLILFSSSSFSQNNWFHQNSGVNTRLNSVQFVDSNTGWCAGENGIILKTTTGGSNWFQQESGTNQKLQSISFPSSMTGYAAGDSGKILKTTNGGSIWFNLNITSRPTHFYSINFINESVGFAGGFPIYISSGIDTIQLYKTIDAGLNWDSVGVPNEFFFTYNYIYQVQFINPTTGWVVGGFEVIQGEELLKTTNGGINWVVQHYQPSWKMMNIFFLDSLYGWASGIPTGTFQRIYRTTDGGSNWMPNNEYALANSIFFVNKNRGICANYGWGILGSLDGGENWIYLGYNEPGIEYHSVHFADSLTGWCVGDSGRILKTTNGGIITSFDPGFNEIPQTFSLSQNYPNPFNPSTIISYTLNSNSEISLIVHDVLGNEVRMLVNEKQNAGRYEVSFNADDLPSGIYFYTLTLNGIIADTKKMVLLR
jgi:photosystem II stability/assembly factor-like uncharacterized protein